ncbi:hypothetical protein NDU88_006310 [Pleurodeles waltl]|uniref:Uncharacterized protein n=1 Tax=Pleurodeles waltl TaxID=8319 RepID=A0AAV7VQ57_PLEWA|nr:hypothetical protein NDU88_006310 [Pleurodeles waltl]
MNAEKHRQQEQHNNGAANEPEDRSWDPECGPGVEVGPAHERTEVQRLRVVNSTGTEFYSTPEETWTWLETRPTPALNASPQHERKQRCPRSNKMQTTYGGGPPAADEIQTARRQALEAAAMIGRGAGRSEATSPQSTQREDEHSDSDSATASSSQSSALLPRVTPSTADEII